MWSALMLAIVALAAFLGIFAPEWVPWALTAIFICGVVLIYAVRTASRSLFGRLDGENEPPARELSFHGLVVLVTFFATMWFSWILR